MRRLTSLYVLIALVGFIAAGCSVSLPTDPTQYSTSVEHTDAFDLVHVAFDVPFDKSATFSDTEYKGILDTCISDGSCGASARFRNQKHLTYASSACQLKAIGNEGAEDRKLAVDCTVVVPDGVDLDENGSYRLVVTGALPVGTVMKDLYLYSTPIIEVPGNVEVASN